MGQELERKKHSPKLQLIGRQHNDIIVNRQLTFSLNLVVREESIRQFVLFGSYHFQRLVYNWPFGCWNKNYLLIT